MGDSVININEMAINYLPKCKNQRKVSFLNETLPVVDYMGSWDCDLTNQQQAIFCNSWWSKNSVYGDISREVLLAWKLALTYNPSLAKVIAKIKVKGQTVQPEELQICSSLLASNFNMFITKPPNELLKTELSVTFWIGSHLLLWSE